MENLKGRRRVYTELAVGRNQILVSPQFRSSYNHPDAEFEILAQKKSKKRQETANQDWFIILDKKKKSLINIFSESLI